MLPRVRSEFQQENVSLFLSAIVGAIAFTGAFYRRTLTGPILVNDPGIYMLNGRLLAHGKLPYYRLWDMKPPAIAETLAVLWTIFPTPIAVYWAALAVTAAAGVISVILVSLLVEELTGDAAATMLSGVTVLAYAPFFELFTIGPYTKYYATASGLAALYLFSRNRPLLSGVAAGLAAAYWQFALGFIVATTLGWLARPDRRQMIPRFVCGVAGIGSLIVAPWLLAGKLDPLINQTVIAPILWGNTGGSIVNILHQYGMMAPILGVGLAGIGLILRDVPRRRSPLCVAVVTALLWFTVGVALVGQTGRPDLIPTAAVIGIAVGYVVAEVNTVIDSSYKPYLQGFAVVLGTGLVLMFIVYHVGTMGYRTSSLAQFIWEGTPVRCHLRRSSPELHWVETVGGDLSAKTCITELVLPR